ncbi:MAG: NUDIX domain-containing protein [Candidatus Pacebacteria bacterium]|nr:NUDIX domain-containing protein [Candidatus Paceibacterota bacterium]
MPIEVAAGVVAVLRTREGDLFLLVRQKDHWSFPKGHIEGDESLLETARRELFEETGISDVEIIPDRSFTEEYVIDRNGVETKKQNTYFLALIKNADDLRPQEGEILECKFVSADEAVRLFSYENSKIILEDAESAINDIDLLA